MDYLNKTFEGAGATKTEKGAFNRLAVAHEKGYFVNCRCFTMKRVDGKYLAVVILSASPDAVCHIPALCDMGVCVVN